MYVYKFILTETLYGVGFNVRKWSGRIDDNDFFTCCFNSSNDLAADVIVQFSSNDSTLLGVTYTLFFSKNKEQTI